MVAALCECGVGPLQSVVHVRVASRRLAAAQAHLDLVRQQQAAQEAKSADIAEQVGRGISRVDEHSPGKRGLTHRGSLRRVPQASRLSASRAMLVATITPLEEEESKLQLLAAGLRESLQLR